MRRAGASRSVPPVLIRALFGALAGAAASVAALILVVNLQPAVVLEMGTDLPRSISSNSFYPVELAGEQTYAWSRPSASIALRGLDRRVQWDCRLRLRAARPPGAPVPHIAMGVDGLTVLDRDAPQDYEEITIRTPIAAAAAGLVLTLGSDPAFVPGADDRRELGLQVDRIACAPAEGARVLPPGAATAAAAIAGAGFGALFAGLLSVLMASGAMVLFAAAVALVVTTGVAPFTPAYLAWFAPLALGITVPILLTSLALVGFGGRLTAPARFVLAFSAAVLFVKIATLLHPGKAVIDAVFHAHRLGWVLDGRYFFTQPMPGGVQFPYAIGLYVTAMPLASLITDHVALLRIVVCVAEAAGAALLYLAITRTREDGWAAACAVVLYHAAPLPYVVIGNANLTYAFGHTISVMALACGILGARSRTWWLTAAAFASATLAFLSHVGVFPLLATTLATAGALYWWTGEAALKTWGRRLVGVTVLGAVLAVGAYYAHFPEVYRTLSRVSAPQAAPADPSAPSAAPDPVPLGARAGRAASLGVRALGWPLLLLGAAGIWLVVRSRRDPVTLMLAACGVTLLIFLTFRIVAPVDARLQRYADEFIERVYYATLPAIAIAAGIAWAWGWRSGTAARLVVSALVLGAIAIGITSWIGWIR